MKYAFGVLRVWTGSFRPGDAPLLAQNDLDQRVAREMDSLVATYKHLHEKPRAVHAGRRNLRRLVAAELRKLGL